MTSMMIKVSDDARKKMNGIKSSLKLILDTVQKFVSYVFSK